jgi:stearoyl-CoA desaturase (delta-9 desaturase)
MTSKIPLDRVNWETSIFLVVTFFTAIIGTPIYIAKFGIDSFMIAMFVFYFLATGMSITLGYHRLFAHKAFKAKKPVKLFTLIFGACAFEDSALDWSSDHEDDDPYSISKGFFFAHMGWIFLKLYPRPLANVGDLKKEPLVMWQHKFHRPIGIFFGLVIPTLIGYLHLGGWTGAVGGLLIIGIARLVAVHHCTFLINSLCHTLGNRPYDASTSARDSWLMAIFTFGEGYHNYHHSFQHDYRNGVKPWQWDPTKWAIWTLSKLGLATDLRVVSDEKIILAEIREVKEQTDAQISDESALKLNSPTRQEAFSRLLDISKSLSDGYKEVEKATGERIDLSREKLAYWHNEIAKANAQLTQFQELQALPS